MNRRRFLELLGMTVASGAVAYSFQSIIVPRNLSGLTMLDIAPMTPEWPIIVGTDYGYPHGLAYIIDNRNRILQAWHPWEPPSKIVTLS